MRLLTLFILLAIFACKNKPAQNETPAGDALSETAVDTLPSSNAAFVFYDTVLVSIGAVDYAAVLKSKPNIPILDLRPQAQYKIGHIWRSVSLDASAKDFKSRLEGLGRTQEYAVYCQFGDLSLQIAEDMKRMGFMRIYHLQKGLNMWGESGQALQLN